MAEQQTWVHRVLGPSRYAELQPGDRERLSAIAETEQPEWEWKHGRAPGAASLLPEHVIGAARLRFGKLKLTDPVRTDVLSFMATELATDELHRLIQVSEIERLTIETGHDSKHAAAFHAALQQARHLYGRFGLSGWKGVDDQARILAERHPNDQQRMKQLVQEIEFSEIEAFRDALKIGGYWPILMRD